MRGLCFILVNLFVVVSLFSSPSSSAPTASIPSLTPLKQRSPPSSYNIFEGADPALNSVYGDSPKRESDPYPPPPREKVVTQEDQVAERRPGAWTPPPSAEEELLPLPLPPFTPELPSPGGRNQYPYPASLLDQVASVLW